MPRATYEHGGDIRIELLESRPQIGRRDVEGTPYVKPFEFPRRPHIDDYHLVTTGTQRVEFLYGQLPHMTSRQACSRPREHATGQKAHDPIKTDTPQPNRGFLGLYPFIRYQEKISIRR